MHAHIKFVFFWIENKNDTTEYSCCWFENSKNSSPIWMSQSYIGPKLMCTHGKNIDSNEVKFIEECTIPQNVKLVETKKIMGKESTCIQKEC